MEEEEEEDKESGSKKKDKQKKLLKYSILNSSTNICTSRASRDQDYLDGERLEMPSSSSSLSASSSTSGDSKELSPPSAAGAHLLLFVCLFGLWAGFRSLTDSPRVLIHL